jgi:hypothetical protein
MLCFDKTGSIIGKRMPRSFRIHQLHTLAEEDAQYADIAALSQKDTALRRALKT